MKNFFNIIQNVINNNSSNSNDLITMLFNNYIIHEKIKSKFIFLDDCLNNIFYTQNMKEDILLLFCKIQKIYHSISRFTYLCQLKKANYKIMHDLFLNPIEPCMYNVITIYHHKYK